jgi:hypothetical protein
LRTVGEAVNSKEEHREAEKIIKDDDIYMVIRYEGNRRIL